MKAKKNQEFKLLKAEDLEKNERNIKYIAIHCAATKPSMKVDRERIKKWHLDRGFSDIGYHFYIRQDGSLEYGRPVYKTGAHVANYNSVSIGVCYEGGIDEDGEAFDTRTPQQKRTLVDLLTELKINYKEALIWGHKDFPKVYKACPSFDAKSEYENL
jgi:hypothetical protein